MDDFGWYYRDRNNQIGPISKQEIQELVKRGVIKNNALIWHPKFNDEWFPLLETEFRNLLPPAPPNRWYIRNNERELGPFTDSLFINVISKNTWVSSETLARRELDDEWNPLYKFDIWREKENTQRKLVSNESTKTLNKNDNDETKPCPYCKNPIKIKAIYCKHCQHYVDKNNNTEN